MAFLLPQSFARTIQVAEIRLLTTDLGGVSPPAPSHYQLCPIQTFFDDYEALKYNSTYIHGTKWNVRTNIHTIYTSYTKLNVCN